MISNTSLFILLVVILKCDGNSKYLNPLWRTFQAVYNKSYTKEQASYRRVIWEENVAFIQKHNLEYDLGLTTYTLGINQYSDLTDKEIQRYLKGAYPGEPSDIVFTYNGDISKFPAEVDWRKKGYVTPVKNQAQCGSCWAFASTGALEGQHFRKTSQLVSLSEQNLVDAGCTYAKGGCNGGWMGNAYDYVKKNAGIDTEKGYPYTATVSKCHYNSSCAGSTCSGAIGIPVGSESLLQAAVATQGPVSVLIDAAHKSFFHYKSGVFYEPTCSNTSVDHAVLVVGYGTESGLDYWLVKNSWGVSYGDKGYIKMSRNRHNNCAIATYGIYPTV